LIATRDCVLAVETGNYTSDGDSYVGFIPEQLNYNIKVKMVKLALCL